MSGRDRGQAAKKRKYRSDGTPIWSRASIDGPGVWVSCVRGKEKAVVGELYDLFESIAGDLWPLQGTRGSGEDDGADDGGGGDAVGGDDADDLEAQIKKEVAAIKRPRTEQRFANCQTNTQCVVFISCKPPVDPIKLVTTHVENVRRTGVTHTKYVLRLVPVTGSCVANLPEIRSLCQRTLSKWTEENPIPKDEPDKKHRYKIELRIRNHNTVPRMDLIQAVAGCVPDSFQVDLHNPDVFILIEVFKAVCGVSIVRDYYRMLKYNVMELAQSKASEKDAEAETSRVQSSGAKVKQAEVAQAEAGGESVPPFEDPQIGEGTVEP
ncbi:hypothetical protein CONPUDRAFT_99698 [Coniophora puteana RWD-64-598 SS2]|uniref:THUMP domain-containing protein n=1 Tax=Coniophora puteana (strain RWD-64-598) TaxID=741705 RepID=A0A5M3MY15_CONPW|nr:uncharacterized protein CONPUDRAFT_99698 [Coniophora puteana RWD-64-598 SS2]EIW83989.1 hypothetical protein CONPUDRAFT_99698 [Coniophora puteana RWD-64-598 SS2]